MEVMATILAGIIILSVPLLLWFRSRARERYNNDLDEIRALSAERHRRLQELRAILDNLEKRGQKESTAIDKNIDWPRLSSTAHYRVVKNRDVDLEKYYSAIKERNIALEKYYLGVGALEVASSIWVVKDRGGPEWLQDTIIRESANAEDVRRKNERWRGKQGSLQGPTPQTS